MKVARFTHTSTLLDDGRVLVTGGANIDDGYVAPAELFDPATIAWLPAGRLRPRGPTTPPRCWPTGACVVAGGLTTKHTELRSAELYDPATNTWSPAGSMRGTALAPHGDDAGRRPRARGRRRPGRGRLPALDGELRPAHEPLVAGGEPACGARQPQATLLADGRVLVAGGGDRSPGFVRSAETTTRRSTAGRPPAPCTRRAGFHAATLLPGGNVLVVGGFSDVGTVRGAELFDPVTGPLATDRLAAARPRPRDDLADRRQRARRGRRGQIRAHRAEHRCTAPAAPGRSAGYVSRNRTPRAAAAAVLPDWFARSVPWTNTR